jgi:hypothetical protein
MCSDESDVAELVCRGRLDWIDDDSDGLVWPAVVNVLAVRQAGRAWGSVVDRTRSTHATESRYAQEAGAAPDQGRRSVRDRRPLTGGRLSKILAAIRAWPWIGGRPDWLNHKPAAQPRDRAFCVRKGRGTGTQHAFVLAKASTRSDRPHRSRCEGLTKASRSRRTIAPTRNRSNVSPPPCLKRTQRDLALTSRLRRDYRRVKPTPPKRASTTSTIIKTQSQVGIPHPPPSCCSVIPHLCADEPAPLLGVRRLRCG